MKAKKCFENIILPFLKKHLKKDIVIELKNKKSKERFLPKHKWGTNQGNFQKVHPLDRI